MKILVGRSSCEINFDATDPKYQGKTLDITGEGHGKEFYIQKPIKMYWSSPSPTNPGRYVGTAVSESEKEDVLAFVMLTAERMGYKLLLW